MTLKESIPFPSVHPTKSRKIINKTKRSCRSELQLSHWSRREYALVDFWPSKAALSYDKLERINANTCSVKEFRKRIEKKNVPCVVLNAMLQWPAMERWTLDKLAFDYRNERFKVGEDDDEKNVYISMRYFMDYAVNSQDVQLDDSPLYIFDSSYADRKTNNSAKVAKGDSKGHVSKKRRTSAKPESKPTCSLLQDYQVPEYFRDDFFKFTGESRRPPYRWIVIGPGRSGTGIHTDPLGTSAWNALISGHKRWVLFPPETPREVVEPKGLGDHEAVTWFQKAYPRFLQEKDPETGILLADKYGMMEVVQGPEEIMFVPSGWHHVVLNLDMTVAVTQNFCSRTNVEYVWLKTRFARPKLALKLLNAFEREAAKEDNPESHVFAKMVGQIKALKTIPALFTSDEGSSSSSSCSSSSSDDDSD